MEKFFTLLIFCCLFSSCSDDDQATMTAPSTTFANRPEADARFDNSYKGIYKGIVIGDISGSLYVDILNDEKIWAQLQTDNHETYVLENISLSETEDGKNALPFFIKYRFGNENVSFEIKLDDTGDNISVSDFKFFSNSTSKVCLVKEKSNSLIKCYTGKFTGQESGNLNFTSDARLKVKGLSKESNSMNFINITGDINLVFPIDGESKIDSDDNPFRRYQLNANLHLGEISGYLEADKFNGNWEYEGNELGNWYATRIL